MIITSSKSIQPITIIYNKEEFKLFLIKANSLNVRFSGISDSLDPLKWFGRGDFPIKYLIMGKIYHGIIIKNH